MGHMTRLTRAGAAIAAALLVAGCTPITTSPTPGASADASASAGQSEVAGVQPIAPGRLEAGVRYTIATLGLSVQPDVDGWLALLPAGGDVAIGREGVTISLLKPDTVLAPDRTQVAAPSEPETFLDAVHASPVVEVVAVELFEAPGVTGLSADLLASGGNASAPLLTTPSGEWGLLDGPHQWVVVTTHAGLVVLAIERPAEPDIDAAWVVAGPLVESLELAP